MATLPTDRITPQEIKDWFGESMPTEVAKLLFEAPGNMSIGEIRTKVRELADEYLSADYLIEEARGMLSTVSRVHEDEGGFPFDQKRFKLWTSRVGVYKMRRHEETREKLGLGDDL